MWGLINQKDRLVLNWIGTGDQFSLFLVLIFSPTYKWCYIISVVSFKYFFLRCTRKESKLTLVTSFNLLSFCILGHVLNCLLVGFSKVCYHTYSMHFNSLSGTWQGVCILCFNIISLFSKEDILYIVSSNNIVKQHLCFR